MATDFFADLHCHPAIRSLNLNKKSLWHTHHGKRDKKIIEAQLMGKRGQLYDQSGYPKLANGKVKLVFASLYPLEQGFMVNNNLFIEGLNIFAKIGIGLSFFFNKLRSVHLRDFALSLFIKFSWERIQELKKQEYWDGLIEEYRAYVQEHNKSIAIASDNLDEIQDLRKKRPDDIPADNQVDGLYQIADGNWNGQLPPGNQILTILTIEGIGIFSQTKNNAPNSKHGTRDESEHIIFERIRRAKTEFPIFFITFSHHFSSGLCGHARSFPDIARNMGFLDQTHFIDVNFSELGYRVLQHLLSVKPEQAGWIDDNNAGRRILIDVKHMSLRGRLTLYQLVSLYNKSMGIEKKIPVIASHVGFSGRSVAQMLATIRREEETTENQIATSVKYGREHTYNTWSINLGVEEIGWIVDSGGLIGISMEQNNLGIGFGKKTREERQPYFAHLVLNQILDMAKACGKDAFWDCIMMGTDYDGVIDPIDHYSSVLFFHGLRNDLEKEFNSLSPAERQEAHCDTISFDLLLDKLFFDNAAKFVNRHFDTAKMPIVH